jgi:hypothetical protein
VAAAKASGFGGQGGLVRGSGSEGSGDWSGKRAVNCDVALGIDDDGGDAGEGCLLSRSDRCRFALPVIRSRPVGHEPSDLYRNVLSASTAPVRPAPGPDEDPAGT